MSIFFNVRVNSIPTDLKECDQWVGFKREVNGKGGLTKVPKNIVEGYNASSKKPEDWVDFKTCIEHIDGFDGIGFVPILRDPFVLWDFDDCCNCETGFIKDEAKAIVEKLNSYTEYSPSGKGLRIIVKAQIGPHGRRNLSRKIEIYDSKQYLSITGRHLKGTPKTIKRRNRICNELHKDIFAKQINNALKGGRRRRNLGSRFDDLRLF